MCFDNIQKITFGKGVIWSSIFIISYIFALIGWVLSITFGVLVLVPASPFVERNIGVGVILIVGCIIPVIPILTFLISLAILLILTSPYFLYTRVRN